MKNITFSNDVWSVIPARSGSKGIKNKNLKKIKKLSLVGRAIKVSKKSKLIQRTFLSTDSDKIKREGLKYKAEVPFLRSKKNSRDSSNDFDILKEFLSRIAKKEKIIPKYIILLRPTTPFRSAKIINKAINKFKKIKNYDSLVTVHKMSEPVHKKFFIKKNKLKPAFSKLTLDQANKPRQNFPNSYTANGYLDIVKTKNIYKEKKYLSKKCFPFIIPKTIDIDESIDLEIANYLVTKQ